ncbi:MAG: glycine--tRNA ligase [Candidatus Nanoarchaeia archaeon]|nr:glycine--tRNA ligase [Candidatus Nanoarchaeia archaeon]
MVKEDKIASIADLASFCKKNGFVFQSGEIYGGLAGFWDYGPLGAELRNNIKSLWWGAFVRKREDVVGIDGAIITHPMVWKASGHVDSFTDPLVDCLKCKERHRADNMLEDVGVENADALSIERMDELIQKKKIKCPKCKGDLGNVRRYNLMFRTQVGPVESESSISYLRPETAQLIFSNFQFVQKINRMKLPFGIAQIGRSFRNEISPRNFLFRDREFEQMEIEFFVHPDEYNKCPFMDEVNELVLNAYSSENQLKKQKMKKIALKELVKKKIMKANWQAYWIAKQYYWFIELGVSPDNLRVRQHLPDEKSHYALDTWDIEYQFPFGWKELQGIANRTTFDMTQHMKYSKKDLQYFDEETGKKVVPYVVAEPSQGVERAFLVFITDSYRKENSGTKDERVVLKLHPKLSPIKIAVFPLLKNDDNLVKKSREIFNELREHFETFYDSSGSIGRRYRRMDEVGTPYCITVDHKTIEDNTVTVRDRDSMEQMRVKTDELVNYLRELLSGKIKFSK